MRFAIVFAMIVLLGAGCADDFASQMQSTTSVIKTKAAEISAAVDSAKKTMEKVQAIYNILRSDSSTGPESSESTPSVPPSEDQPQPVTEENTSSQ